MWLFLFSHPIYRERFAFLPAIQQRLFFFSKTETVFASTWAKSKLSNRDFLMSCIFVLLVFMQMH